ncbi:zinc-binding dehydrogenase [Paraburkholderia caribensis]|uniref:zinc-binding dehydrogenase n=1 Tax=Paraburkholderia caribensis TaxID=75105 RepID=UPI001F37226A
MKTIVMDGPGGPEKLRLAECGEPVAGPGKAVIDRRRSRARSHRCGARARFWWYVPVLGAAGPLHITSLPKSIKIGYATFADHVHTPALLRARAKQLFDWIIACVLDVRIGGVYPLADAARAHADVESRRTMGKLLLIP